MKDAIAVIHQLIDQRGAVFGARCATHPKQYNHSLETLFFIEIIEISLLLHYDVEFSTTHSILLKQQQCKAFSTLKHNSTRKLPIIKSSLCRYCVVCYVYANSLALNFGGAHPKGGTSKNSWIGSQKSATSHNATDLDYNSRTSFASKLSRITRGLLILFCCRSCNF
jgi:hypothetical protein